MKGGCCEGVEGDVVVEGATARFPGPCDDWPLVRAVYSRERGDGVLSGGTTTFDIEGKFFDASVRGALLRWIR